MKTNDFNNITDSWELNTNIISVKINPLLKKKVTIGSKQISSVVGQVPFKSYLSNQMGKGPGKTFYKKIIN